MSSSSDVTSPPLNELLQPESFEETQNDQHSLILNSSTRVVYYGAISSSSGGAAFNGGGVTSSSGEALDGATSTHPAETKTLAAAVAARSDDLDNKGWTSKHHWLDDPITPSRHGSINHSGSSTLGSRQEHRDTPATQVNQDKYEESALYIREGEDAKFYHHPQDKCARGAYLILHYQLYYFLHFLVCMLLLLLAFAENPSVARLFLNQRSTEILVIIHAVLELILLILLVVNVVFHVVWYRKKFFKHRIFLISIILVVMIVEALTVIIRQQNHIRITRIFRPLFLLDTYYMTGVRRVTRQIIQILKPILDVILLLIFFIILFSLFGYLIFAEMDPDYFKTFSISFVSLFITASSANNPDVMMEAYARHNATPIFYVVYLVITLYFASNMLLAVVFVSFSEEDKEKFKTLFCHKRDALLQAFHVLSEDNPHSEVRRLQFHDFLLMMQRYRPRIPEWQVMCIFKSLNKDPNSQYQYGGLDEEDFLRFYEVLDFEWTLLSSEFEKLKWYSNFKPVLAQLLGCIHRIVSHKLYKFIIGLVVLANLIVLIVYANRIKDPTERFEKLKKVLPGTFAFLSIYSIDIIFNILGYGPYDYFRKFWNLADLAVILISLISAFINLFHGTWAILLPLKLLRLICLKRHYRDLMNTMVDVAPRLISVLVLILIIYYCFAIIGMEFLFDKLEQGCCKDALYDVGNFFADSIDNVTSQSPFNVYYIINFNNILRSYVTLFVLMVVNNWYIIMEGFVSEVHTRTHWLTRLYFIMFYLITLVVVQVIIAFIVEAFVLKIQAAIKRRICLKHPHDTNCGCPYEKKKKITIKLVEQDIAKIRYEKAYMENQFKGAQNIINKYIRRWRQKRFGVKNYQQEVNLVGSRSHTKEDIHQIHYRDEIKVETQYWETGETGRVWKTVNKHESASFLQAQIWRKEKTSSFRRQSSFQLEQLRQSERLKKLCKKIGKCVIDFVMD